MYLGLDLGTSGLKALLLDKGHGVVAVATAPLDSARRSPGWSEQDPVDWIAACTQVLDDLSDHLGSVQAIGIAGHMHGVVLLDAAGEVVRPCLLWNDTRAGAEAAAMDADPAFRAISGTIVFPGFSAPKMAWVRDHEPDHWARTERVLFPKDFLAYWLTGTLNCEPSDAAGSALFDPGKGDWSPALCAAAGLSPDLLPPVIDSDSPRGPVRVEIAERFGLNPACMIAGGAGDNAAASLGIGAVKNGEGQVSLGTSGVLLTVNERWTPHADSAVHSFSHAAAGCYIQMGVTLTATDSLSWLADLLGTTPGALSDALAGALQDENADGPGEVLFLPYLAGERTPHNLDRPAGGFFGLSRSQGPQAMTRAVMEGVAYSLADCAAALTAAGAQVEKLTAVGGGARSHFWLQTLADVLERPLTLNPQAEHAAALGAARLAMAAASGRSVVEVIDAAPAPDDLETIQPRPETFTAYRAVVQRYRDLFNALKEV
ncbi:MAG TPA: xylulokinase [Alphaproteobacteria bacterium]|nr:xylulokinase [Alphaproteobacteria bacterium]